MIFSPVERLVAMRYLRSRRQEGFVSLIAWFSFLGIGLGVATLIVMLSVMNGFQAELVARVMGVSAHATVTAPGQPLRDYTALADRIAAAPGVTAVMPAVDAQALVTVEGRATGVAVRGLEPADIARRPVVANSLLVGSWNLREEGIAVGAQLARQLGVSIGSEITLVSPRGTPTPFGTVPRTKTYRVVALFDVRMADVNATTVFMPLAAAQTFFRLPAAVTGLDVFVAAPLDLPRLRAALEQAAGPDLTVTDWRQANASYVTALDVERTSMFLILSLIVLVAAFNIVSSLIMLVREKGAAIAILRTMGATRGQVLRIFLLAGASIGVVGTLGGFALGLIVCANTGALGGLLTQLTGGGALPPELAIFADLPAIVDWSQVARVVGMGLVLSILATLYPAWRAARLDPVEALRYG